MDLNGQTHAVLSALRNRTVDPAEQRRIAPAEHRAFAREWTQEQPLLAVPSLIAAIPAYSVAKAAGILRARTPASLDEMAEGYRGLGEGIQALWNK